jgi:hypothetical protein
MTRKQKSLIALVGLLALCLVITGGCSKRDRVLDTGQSQGMARGFLRFSEPLSLQDADAFAVTHGLEVLAFQRSLELGGEHFTVFLPGIKGESPNSRFDRWQSSWSAFVKSSTEMTANIAASASESRDRVSFQELAQALATATQAPLDPRVDAVIVEGAGAALEALSPVAPLQSIEIRQLSDEGSSPPHDVLGPGQFPVSSDAGTWVPRSGLVITRPSPYYSGQREAYNYFIWGNTSGFFAGSGYEHDFYLSTNSGTYLDGGSDIFGFPHYQYAVTNLPSAYLDSRSGDDGSVKLYTLGCADARSIARERQYYTYWRTNNGNASVDRGGLTAQLTYHACSSNNTWCMWGLTSVPIASGYPISVPGDYYWNR